MKNSKFTIFISSFLATCIVFSTLYFLTVTDYRCKKIMTGEQTPVFSIHHSENNTFFEINTFGYELVYDISFFTELLNDIKDVLYKKE